MSDICDGTYDVYSESIRKSRKQHKCSACGLPIRVGDYYCSVHMVYDGEAETIKRCGSCQTTHLHLRKLCRESADVDWPDSRWPDDLLECGRDYVDEWGEEPPDAIARLPLLSDDERGRLLARKAGGSDEHA